MCLCGVLYTVFGNRVQNVDVSKRRKARIHERSIIYIYIFDKKEKKVEISIHEKSVLSLSKKYVASILVLKSVLSLSKYHSLNYAQMDKERT